MGEMIYKGKAEDGSGESQEWEVLFHRGTDSVLFKTLGETKFQINDLFFDNMVDHVVKENPEHYLKLIKEAKTERSPVYSEWFDNNHELHYWNSLEKLIELSKDEKQYRIKLDGIEIRFYATENYMNIALKLTKSQGIHLGNDHSNKIIIVKGQ